MTTRRMFLASGAALASMLGAMGATRGTLAQDATPGADATCPALDAAAMDALGRGWATAWGTGDTAFFAEHAADGFVHHSAGMHSALGDQVPLEVVQEQALQWRKGFADFAVEVQFSIVAGEYVAWLFSMTGTHTGDFYGSPATNMPIIDTGITVLHVQCGKVVESWGAWDRGDFLDQLGLLELPEPDPTDTPATPDAFIEGVCAPASGEETVAIARRYWDVVWGSPLTDVAQLDGVTSLYVEGHLPFQMPIVGQEALVRRVTRWKTCMPDLVFTPHTILGGVTFDANGVGAGAHAVTLWTATGTPTGPYPALDFPGRPDAEPLTWRGIDIFRTNCGRVEEVWSEFDKFRLLEAIRGQ